MQNTDASRIPVQWSVSWGVASKADGPADTRPSSVAVSEPRSRDERMAESGKRVGGFQWPLLGLGCHLAVPCLHLSACRTNMCPLAILESGDRGGRHHKGTCFLFSLD